MKAAGGSCIGIIPHSYKWIGLENAAGIVQLELIPTAFYIVITHFPAEVHRASRVCRF